MTATDPHARPTTASAKSRPGAWRGPTRSYDLAKEFVVALLVVTLATVGLAVLFGSPDEKGATLKDWARAAPNDFVVTTVTELDGTSASASYGPPYNNASTGQSIAGPIRPQKWAGVHIPVDPAQDLVIHPLSTVVGDPMARAAVAQWQAATPDQRTAWAQKYDDALTKVEGDPTKVVPGDYGPVPELAGALLTMARSGALDSSLVDSRAGFFQTDYTKPMLFLADGTYFDDRAGAQHLHGDQWGMMNETGSYPGQAWLWLYTFWYQVPPFSDGSAWADNADAMIWALMMLLSLALALVPFIPGLRSIPRWVPLYRLIWRDYYRKHAVPTSTTP